MAGSMLKGMFKNCQTEGLIPNLHFLCEEGVWTAEG